MDFGKGCGDPFSGMGAPQFPGVPPPSPQFPGAPPQFPGTLPGVPPPAVIPGMPPPAVIPGTVPDPFGKGSGLDSISKGCIGKGCDPFSKGGKGCDPFGKGGDPFGKGGKDKGKKGPKPGDWTCPNCGDNVFARRMECNQCKTPRPGSPLAAQQAQAQQAQQAQVAQQDQLQQAQQAALVQQHMAALQQDPNAMAAFMQDPNALASMGMAMGMSIGDEQDPKRLRTDQPEALTKLQSAIQGAMQKVAIGLNMSEGSEQADQMPQMTMPDASSWPAAEDDGQAKRTDKPEQSAIVTERIHFLNTKGGFEGRIKLDKVMVVAPYVDLPFTMKVLRDVEERKSVVKDPTAFVCAALRRVAENEASPHSRTPAGGIPGDDDGEADIASLQRRMLTELAKQRERAKAESLALGLTVPAPVPEIPGMMPPGAAGMMPPGAPGMMPGAVPPVPGAMGMPGQPAGFGAAPPAPTKSCLPPGNAAMLKKQGMAVPDSSVFAAPAPAAPPTSSCLPPGNLAALKKLGGQPDSTAIVPQQPLMGDPTGGMGAMGGGMGMQPPMINHNPQPEAMGGMGGAMGGAGGMAGGSEPSSVVLPIPLPMHLQANPLANQVYMLATQAEDAQQTAASAAAICMSLQGEKAKDVEILVQTANQSAQRAAWASNWLNSYFPPLKSGDPDADWYESLRTIINQAGEKAEAAATTCRTIYNVLTNKTPLKDEDGKRIKVKLKCCHAFTNSGYCSKGALCTFAHGEEEIGTPQPVLSEEQKQQLSMPVPCKFFVTSYCRNGDNCEYSHDPSVFEPRPLEQKRPVDCVYFEKGICTRGAGCPFAHGPEELQQIMDLHQSRQNPNHVGLNLHGNM